MGTVQKFNFLSTVIVVIFPTLSHCFSLSSPRVSGHCASVSEQRKLWLFGGLSATGNCVNHLWSYDHGTQNWLPASPLPSETVNGDGAGLCVPSARMYAASACVGNNLYIFGGWTPPNSETSETPSKTPSKTGKHGAAGTGMFHGDAWKLDTSRRPLTWKSLAPLPYPVSRHSACTVGGQVIAHTHKGILVKDSEDRFNLQPTAGEGPNGLSMCSIAPYGEDSVIVFGGSSRTQNMSSDVFRLDIKTWRWTKLRVVDGIAPSPRAACCMSSTSNYSYVICGGAGISPGGYDGGKGLVTTDELWHLDVVGDTAFFYHIPKEATLEPRVAATMTPLPSLMLQDSADPRHRMNSQFMVAGGWDPQTKKTFTSEIVEFEFILDEL